MKLRIIALVLLGLCLIGTTAGAVLVGSGPVKPAPAPPATEEQPPAIQTTTADPVVTQTVPTKETQGYVPTPNHVRFLAAGDNLVYNYIYRNANILAGGSGDPTQFKAYGFEYAPMYENLRSLIANTDLAFYNQESLVTDDRESGGKTASLGDGMLELGFNVVNIANNDMLASGEEGLLKSIEYWKEKENVALLGANVTEDTKNQITVIEKNNIKIAFLAYADGAVEKADGTVKTLELPEGSSLTLPLIDEERMTADVTAAKEQADLVFVYLHWGLEGQSDRTSEQSNVAQHLVDLNVDVILGSHPNVIQEMKWKRRADGGQTLICYSLGNLISAQPYNSNLLGGLVAFDIDKKEDGSCKISAVEFIPTFTHYDENYKQIKVHLLKDYSQVQLDAHGSSILKGKGKYDNFVRTVLKYVPASFLDPFYKDYVFTS